MASQHLYMPPHPVSRFAVRLIGIGMIAIAVAGCQTMSTPAAADSFGEVSSVQDFVDEPTAWVIVKQSRDMTLVRQYVDRFPDSPNASTARLRLRLLEAGALR